MTMTVVMVVLSGCGLTRELAVRSLINPMRLPVLATPGDAHRDITFVTNDGLVLEGWLFEPAQASKGLVVFLHGKDANRGHFANDARRFTHRGYTVLAYDQRAHGRSQGEFCTFGVKEVPDLQRAIDRFAPAGGRVFVIGESMGAAVALEAAARDPRIKAVVAGASFSDLRIIIKERQPFFVSDAVFDEAVLEAQHRAGFEVDLVSPAADAAHISVPVLLLHGTEDPFIPLQHSYRIRAQLHGPDDSLLTLYGVQHIDVLLHQEAWAAIEQWFDRIAL